ncbi:pyridoxal phosphate-dependent aminotransferase family protein [Dyadobacter sp. UC 10]|nr:pyridoxal phosphate-dependent aminotransferase family protein [Dyadobacter sp. UC 10]
MNAFQTNKLPGRTVQTLEGNEYLWFSGTDYLGMAYNSDFQSFLREGFEHYGTHFGSSRNGSLRLAIYQEAEESFAAWQCSEAALLVSSGMLAGQLLIAQTDQIIRQLDNPGRILFHYAPKVHPAIRGTGYYSNTLDWKTWAQLTVDQINAGTPEMLHIICSDAVGSPMVEQFDFSVFDQIDSPDSCRLIIDQSHSLGVLGESGFGIARQISQALLGRTTFVSSLNKALGIPAGIIWGDRNVIDLLSQSPLYAGASPSAPVYISAFKRLLTNGNYTITHANLLGNINYFAQQFQNSADQFIRIPDYPVFCATDPALFDFLLKNGIMGSCFPYPLSTDVPVTRIAISAAHQKKDLDCLAEVCKRFKPLL